MLEVFEIVNSVSNSKTYVLYAKGFDKAWLIDMGDLEPVLLFLRERNLTVAGVFLTHGHFDHFYGLQSLVEHYPDCKVYATAYTKQAITSEKLNLSTKCEKPIRYEGDNIFVVQEGVEIVLFEGEPPIHIYEVPGHDPGCMAMIVGDYIFTGDAYIPNLGVKDFVPYANKEQAKQSMERILKLAEGKTVFAGHYVISVYELLWRTTLQVVVTKDEEAQRIKNWGSGFLFNYKENSFFITADHVAHLDDFEMGQRLGKDDFVWAINNKNNPKELSTLLTPIKGIFSFDLFDLNDVLPEIPILEDIAFSIVTGKIEVPFYTHELIDRDGNVIVPAGKEKLYIKEESVTEMDFSDYYIVGSCVKWNIEGIRLDYLNVVHEDLAFKEVNADGYYVLKYPEPVIKEYWQGVSGAPVFNQLGRLVGMLIEVNEIDDTVVVVPMKKIMHFIDYAIQYEETLNR